MIYPAPAIAVGPPPPGFEEVRLPLPEGGWVQAWHRPRPGAPLAVLFFHGNGENLETMRRSGLTADLARLDGHLLAVEYPGYGDSPGRPSERSLTAAAVAASAWLAERHRGSRQAVVGWSLGAGVASRLLDEGPGPFAGGVLLSPWTSLPEVARRHFPGFLVALLVSERYDSVAAAARLPGPILVIHGVADRIIPVEQGRRLAAELGERGRLVEVPGAGHNDLLARPDVWREIERFLGSIAP
ncbi:MAG: alpha/beta fold hydrolase [Thermoanaerobaculia bacterium]|nr:alpha/beta fold hydrolase [Thermoanaerobaculia bacterium]